MEQCVGLASSSSSGTAPVLSSLSAHNALSGWRTRVAGVAVQVAGLEAEHDAADAANGGRGYTEHVAHSTRVLYGLLDDVARRFTRGGTTPNGSRMRGAVVYTRTPPRAHHRAVSPPRTVSPPHPGTHEKHGASDEPRTTVRSMSPTFDRGSGVSHVAPRARPLLSPPAEASEPVQHSSRQAPSRAPSAPAQLTAAEAADAAAAAAAVEFDETLAGADVQLSEATMRLLYGKVGTSHTSGTTAVESHASVKGGHAGSSHVAHHHQPDVYPGASRVMSSPTMAAGLQDQAIASFATAQHISPVVRESALALSHAGTLRTSAMYKSPAQCTTALRAAESHTANKATHAVLTSALESTTVSPNVSALSYFPFFPVCEDEYASFGMTQRALAMDEFNHAFVTLSKLLEERQSPVFLVDDLETMLQDNARLRRMARVVALTLLKTGRVGHHVNERGSYFYRSDFNPNYYRR